MANWGGHSDGFELWLAFNNLFKPTRLGSCLLWSLRLQHMKASAAVHWLTKCQASRTNRRDSADTMLSGGVRENGYTGISRFIHWRPDCER